VGRRYFAAGEAGLSLFSFKLIDRWMMEEINAGCFSYNLHAKLFLLFQVIPLSYWQMTPLGTMDDEPFSLKTGK